VEEKKITKKIIKGQGPKPKKTTKIRKIRKIEREDCNDEDVHV